MTKEWTDIEMKEGMTKEWGIRNDKGMDRYWNKKVNEERRDRY